ncbi:hypothetical protein FACS189499_07110 [Clostridia bacterium]|nr:hypothetical protein FACS189499_07110 [Clostridia bacterium]
MYKLGTKKHSKLPIKQLLGAIVIIIAAVFAILGRVNANSTAERKIAAEDCIPEIISFLSEYGWRVTPEPVDINKVQIPKKFSESYQRYNDMQKKQGFDLSKHRNKPADIYVFRVENYPASVSSEVYANVIIIGGKIAGGEICSYALDGFLTGFASS